MIFTVENTGNKFEHARRKQQYLELIRTVGAEITGTTAESFSVKFPRSTSRAEVQGFIDSVAAIGTHDGQTPGDVLVTAEPSDAIVLVGGDNVNGPILETALARGEVAAKDLLPEDFFSTIDNASFGPSVDSMTEKQKDEAYESMRAIRGELPSEDGIFGRRVVADDDDPLGAKELDRQLAEHLKSGEAARWHRDRGF